MNTPLRSMGLALVCTLWAAAAAAQAQPTSTTEPPDTRPATTTAAGDTGLWYVPGAEVLPPGKWSMSLYRASQNYIEGFSNVADFNATVAVGIARAIEVFTAITLDRRIDRDIRPIFTSNEDVGGPIPTSPLVRQGWSKDQFGDILVGLKFNLMSEEQQKPAAVAVRAAVKLPTGDKDTGVGTGKVDALFDLVVSKERSKAEIAGYGGFAVRGKAEGITSSANAFRWGFGAGFPSRGALRLTAELTGELLLDDSVELSTPLDGSDVFSELSYKSHSTTGATLGVTWQSSKGIFLGGGMTWNFPGEDRTKFNTDQNTGGICVTNCPPGDFVDYQFRIGYHPGVKIYVPPPPPEPPPPPPPAPAANRPPTVQAACNPCSVQVGQTSTVTATGQDPDGDMLRYAWAAPSGSFQNQQVAQTVWTAPQQPGAVQATVTVNDGRGGTASASTTIQVLPPPPVAELTFDDVFFDFDRSTLRPEALRLLDDAVTKLTANPGRNITIEGHTCNIGTAEYNLALGERRAEGVRAYLASRGVAAGRLQVVSYGEERPKYDNAREETRRLNRRAALVVRVQ